MIKIRVNVADGATPALKELISMLTGSQAAQLNGVAGRAAVLEATRYHREYDDRGGWENRSLPTHGPGRDRTGFGKQVADSWNVAKVDSDGVTISNDAPHLGHKVRGGTIRPKRVSALTIPMVPEAHGRRASEYERDFGVDLFTIKGRNALFERTKGIGSESVLNRTYGKRRNGQREQIAARGKIRAVYALTRSVTHDPWKGALPPEEDLREAFANAWRTEMIERL